MKAEINKETIELTLTREFNGNINKVWEAWTNPEILEKWWGPKGWITKIYQMEVKPGGIWHYCMTSAEYEMESWGKAFYLEIEEPNLLVYKDTFSDKDGNIVQDMPVMIIRNEFHTNGEKTILKSITKFESLVELQKVIDMGAEEGIKETWDRLDEYLVK